MRSVDLNADVGEGQAAVEAALLPLVTSANVACGLHAGDPATMRATVALALRHGIAISPADAADSTIASRCSYPSGAPRRAACRVTAAEPLASPDAMNKPPSNLLLAHRGMLVAASSTPE